MRAFVTKDRAAVSPQTVTAIEAAFVRAVGPLVCPLKPGPSRSMGFAQFRRTRDG